jgi:cytoskeletal protein RodZ
VPAGIGAMFAIDIFYEALGAGMMAGLYSTLTMIVIVAVLRILYALFLENGAVRQTTGSTASFVRQHEVGAPEDKAILAATTTSHLVQPRSVTEQTTRQLGPNQ